MCERWSIQRGLNSSQIVYGVSRGMSMRELMTQQPIYYGARLDDAIIDSETSGQSFAYETVPVATDRAKRHRRVHRALIGILKT